MKLSPYTLAKNCTDLTDMNDGIQEIREEIKKKEQAGKKVPYFYYGRLSKFMNKKEKLINK